MLDRCIMLSSETFKEVLKKKGLCSTPTFAPLFLKPMYNRAQIQTLGGLRNPRRKNPMTLILHFSVSYLFAIVIRRYLHLKDGGDTDPPLPKS